MTDGGSHVEDPGTADGPRLTTVTTDHVRALLDSSGEERVLIVIRGQVEVVDVAKLQEPEYSGALHVASSRDLDAMAALSPPHKAHPDVLASVLQAAVNQLGA
ncbi:hypothetical protein [Streptomyces sp. ISL-94]|uniref:hypothetical protein n=1 Tax=Streptomyces sp. ISL-94 TaxID=2819190 RepID=UPI001BEBFD25|nr:hypothetical protein [Streptomyces sp. ISL-94]MBT2479746.1 hypothetical protein [Streptomyces sp. ISL-94]